MSKNDTTTLHDLGDFEVADLHTEIEHLAGTYGTECDGLLMTVKALKTLEREGDRVEAALDLQIRHTAEISGEKTTEKKIKSAVEATDTWNQIQAQIGEAEHAVERHKLAMKVLDKKERALELIARFQIKEMGIGARTQ